MGNLFGIRRRAPVVTAQDRAILQIKQQRDKIKIYQKRTEIEVESNKNLALKLFQDGRKERALVILRRKKYMEETINRLEKQLETLEQLVTDIEYSQIEVSVVEGLKVGSEALKQLNSLMSIEDIQQIMEDNEEAAAKQQEISDILTRSSARFDESELLEELNKYLPPKEIKQDATPEEIKQDATPEKIKQDATPDVAEVINKLPEVPVEEIPKAEEPTQANRVERVRELEPA